MSPDERTALNRAGLATLALCWCVWLIWPVSREVALILLVAWLFLIVFWIEGKG